MRSLDMLNPYRWLILLAVVAGLAGAHLWRVNAAEKRGFAAGDTAGAARVQAQFDRFKGESISLVESARKEALRVSEITRQNFASRDRELNNEIRRIAADRDALAASLSKRPDRPAGGSGGGGDVPGYPADRQVASGCTGAELFRQDSEFLSREAARAEVTRLGLLKCYADLDEARKLTSDFTQSRAGEQPR